MSTFSVGKMPCAAARRLADHRAAAVLLQPVHAGEQAVVETLHADRQARDARIAIAPQVAGSRWFGLVSIETARTGDSERTSSSVAISSSAFTVGVPPPT